MSVPKKFTLFHSYKTVVHAVACLRYSDYSSFIHIPLTPPMLEKRLRPQVHNERQKQDEDDYELRRRKNSIAACGWGWTFHRRIFIDHVLRLLERQLVRSFPHYIHNVGWWEKPLTVGSQLAVEKIRRRLYAAIIFRSSASKRRKWFFFFFVDHRQHDGCDDLWSDKLSIFI